MHATIDPRQWPGRVVPESDAEVAAAVASLCLRAQWPDADRAGVTSVLRRWFDRGWCVDAVLRAVDLTPDGRLQRRKSDRQAPHAFLKDRLRWWFADHDGDSATDPLPPPVPGMTMERWWAISRRNERVNRPREHRPLGAEGRRARQDVRARARGSGRDAVAMARAKGRQRQDVLDDLLIPGAEPVQVEPVGRPRRRPVDRRVGDWVGRQQVVADDPAVRKALDVVLASAGNPPVEAVKRLRNAVRAARWTARMAAMEAMTDAPDGAPEPLGREARRVLHYVDQAVEENLPFEVVVFLLRTGTPSADR
ncbi:hypothetical protein [Saccharothrix syringae]|uniref:Uncharacterized protein n=1 Tax=Saccharothrix syringae TaxID=103733 RepID=A0A5Q0GWN7_SACSY|nr:hypothetical protein [Saccharothrix syringae]QFZ17880.1 hypothetical protein EKG83_10655 [Saccharothrix syringae]